MHDDDSGHLFVSARGGVEFAGDARHVWLDAAHRCALVLSPRSRQLRRVALDTTLGDSDSNGSSDDDDGESDDDDKRDSSADTLFDFNNNEADAVALARLSLDGQFLALQTSDIEVQVVARTTRERFYVLCRPNAGNRILADGVIWSTHASGPGSSQDLFLVTKMGLEHYRVSLKRRSCALHRVIGVYIHTFWYAASHGVLIVSTGSRATEIVPYLLRGANVERLPRLVFSVAVARNDLYLAPLYGQLYAVYGDTRSAKLLLYLIERNKVSCVRSLNLMLPPGTALEYSVVDNLLACHSLAFNVSLFFDIKCDGSVSEPFSHPLPISLRAPARTVARVGGAQSQLSASSTYGSPRHEQVRVFGGSDSDDDDDDGDNASACVRVGEASQHHIRRAQSVDSMDLRATTDGGMLRVADDDETGDQTGTATRSHSHKLERAMTTMSFGAMDHHQFESDKHYFSRWRFVAPNLVLRSSRVKGRRDEMEQIQVRKLQANLRGIARSCARHKDVLPFLLRRGDHALAKTLALGLVRDAMQEQELTLSSVVNLLNAVQTMTHHDVEHGADEALDDSSSDDESSIRSFASSPALSVPQDSTPRLAHSSSFRDRVYAESRSKSSVSVVAALPSRNMHGLLLVFQSEFYDHVWDSLLRDSAVAANGRLSIYLTEFVRNLHVNMVPIENCTYLALARSFLSANEPDKLYQFLQSHMLADSAELAGLLVRAKTKHRALLQAGLDMYTRLGCINPLVEALLRSGEVDRAIAISWRNMRLSSFDASVVPALQFYDAMMESIWASRAASSASSFQVAQRLRKLLLFLKVWDPSSLEPSGNDSASLIARDSTTRFPGCLLDPAVASRLRAAFGFLGEE